MLAAERSFIVLPRGQWRTADVLVIAEQLVTAQTIEVMRKFATAVSAPQILITDRPLPAGVLATLQCRLAAVISGANATEQRLIATILAVKHGKIMLPMDMQSQLIDEVKRLRQEVLRPRVATTSGLTERELAVLQMLSIGADIGDIAHALSYSERTVKNIIHTLLSRTGLKNRVHAVSFAIRSGLI
jgi:DNA-binding NarL/FixJ family response regulator